MISTPSIQKLTFTFALLVAGCLTSRAADVPGTYKVTRTIKVGGDGGWDYATLDAKGERLYLPRTTHTQVIDTASGKMIADIKKGQLLHGVALVPALNRGFVTDGKGATVIIFDLKTFDVLGEIPAAVDADGIIYDAGSNRVLVACGDASALLIISPDVDPKTGKVEANVDLGGKPEFLAADGKGKAYVNIQDKGEIAVVDIKSMKLETKWKTAPGTSPTGLSIDPEAGRLYDGCRNKKMIVLDTKDGSVLGDLPIGPGVDATVFNKGTAFASCSDGSLAVIRETSPGKFEVAQTVMTNPGSRTMAINRQTGTIYLPGAEMQATKNPTGLPGRPQPVPGTFKVIVVEQTK